MQESAFFGDREVATPHDHYADIAGHLLLSEGGEAQVGHLKLTEAEGQRFGQIQSDRGGQQRQHDEHSTDVHHYELQG